MRRRDRLRKGPPVTEGEPVSGESVDYLMPYKWTFGPDDYVEVIMGNPRPEDKDDDRMWAKIKLSTLAQMMSCFDFTVDITRGGFISLNDPRLVRAMKEKQDDKEIED
jgi:hypothetical protein